MIAERDGQGQTNVSLHYNRSLITFAFQQTASSKAFPVPLYSFSHMQEISRQRRVLEKPALFNAIKKSMSTKYKLWSNAIQMA